mgnify:CR=1 FL=1
MIFLIVILILIIITIVQFIREKNDDILKEDYTQRFDADFVLMTGILSQLTENLLHDFGGEKERL